MAEVRSYNKFRIKASRGRIWVEQLHTKKRLFKRKLDRYWITVYGDSMVFIYGLGWSFGDNLPSLEYAKAVVNMQRERMLMVEESKNAK